MKRSRLIAAALSAMCFLSACAALPHQPSEPDTSMKTSESVTAPAEDPSTLYTAEEITIAVPKEWDGKVLVNPGKHFYVTPQTLFALFCEDAFSDAEDSLGWVLSVCRYSEEEYREMYLESPARQYVFARDAQCYYCVLLPTDVQTDDPDLHDFMENIRDSDIRNVLRDMISRNHLEAYKDRDAPAADIPSGGLEIAFRIEALQREEAPVCAGEHGAVRTFEYDQMHCALYQHPDSSDWFLCVTVDGIPYDMGLVGNLNSDVDRLVGSLIEKTSISQDTTVYRLRREESFITSS